MNIRRIWVVDVDGKKVLRPEVRIAGLDYASAGLVTDAVSDISRGCGIGLIHESGEKYTAIRFCGDVHVKGNEAEVMRGVLLALLMRIG